MVSFAPDLVLLCLAVVLASRQVIDATIFAGKDVAEDSPVAEERIFKGKKAAPQLGKKKILSLFAHAAQPQVVHTLAPIEHYPIWKVHKYKGIEFRPVQVVDIPSPFDYSPVQPEYYQPATEYGAPSAEPVRIPHTEYGAPVVDHNSFASSMSGITITEEPTVYQGSRHGGTLTTLLGFLKNHGGFLAKLKNLKSWKSGLKRGHSLHSGYGLPLPEIQEIPVKGLEHLDLQVPELPTVGLPPYGSAITGGPYVKVQVATPTPVTNYGYPQYAPQYVYQYPPQSAPEGTPAPYYGPPQLYNSYGMPLPADAYSAPSDQVLSFAVPENPTRGAQLQHPEEFYASNTTGVAQKAQEIPGAKFLTEEEANNKEEEITKDGGDAVANPTSH